MVRQPGDRTLADTAEVLNDMGHSALVVDDAWRVEGFTDDLHLSSNGMLVPSVPVPLGSHVFGPNVVEHFLASRRAR